MKIAHISIATAFLSASLFAGDWFVAPKYSTNFTAKTKRDTDAKISALGQTVKVEDGANADRDLDSYGLSVGKNFENYRAYLSYDKFDYSKKREIFADKDVDGWVVTANADYVYNIYGPVSLFAGANLTVAGSKPEGMDSNPAPGYGGQIGIIAQLYKTQNYKVSAEIGYRYIKTAIKASEKNNAEQLMMLKTINPYFDGVTVKTETTALKNSYFAVNISF